MKKVISFVLVLALVLGSFSMAFAVPADVEGTDYEDAVTALTNLGVVTGYPDGTYQPAKAVTRAEAAKLVVTALGLAEYAAGNTASFNDLAGYGWAAGYIGYAEALGILKGDGNGNFRPADPVSYQEMATMLVRACGYTDASLPGTWPANYVVKAKALGIMDDIAQAGSAAANRGDVAVMIFNNLENRIGTINLDNQWIANTPADTMMARLDQDLYAPDNTAVLYDGTTGAGAAFVLDGTETYADDVNLKAYLGNVVVGYANIDGELTGIKAVKTTIVNGDVVVDTDNTVNLEVGDVTYKLDRVLANDTATFTAVTFENGVVTGAAVATAAGLDGVDVAVEISGKYITAIWSIADWTPVETVMWDEDYAEALADDFEIGSGSFTTTDKDEIDTESFVLNGVATLDDIKADDMVTYYVDNNGIARVDVCDTVITGKVTEESADGQEFTINGKVYYAAANPVDTTGLELGAEGSFYLDYAGDITYVDLTETAADNYAIVLTKIGYETVGYGESSKVKIELFTVADGEKIYTIDKDITAAAITAVTGSAVDTVVEYGLNKDGEISTIAAVTTTDASVYTAKGIMDGYKLDASVLVYAYDGSDWAVADKADIPVDDAIAAGAVKYVKNTDNLIELVLLGEDAVAADSTYGVVSAYTKVWDADEAEVAKLDAIIGGVEKNDVLTDDYSSYTTSLDAIIAAPVIAEISFAGDVVDGLTIYSVTGSAVQKVEGDFITVTGAGYVLDVVGATTEAVDSGKIVEVADGAVVYSYDSEDGYALAKVSKIAKGDTVYLFDTDTDVDGVEIIVFVEN
ncbi:MAG: S-layer homology domain-containing protein [Clostridiales bacterium]|nr:S-layer homology domain-containing protein [Clostridiales bacterium]